MVERQHGSVSSVGVTDGLRGSTTGLLEGCRGSVLGMHSTVTQSVHIVNPTPTMATAPGSATSTAPGLKRSGHSPHVNRSGVSRSGPSPPSTTVPSGVTHSPDNSQRSTPVVSADSAKQSSVSASNAANPAASANAAGAVAATATGSTMSGPGSVGNVPGAAAGPDGRPISLCMLCLARIRADTRALPH